MTASHFEAINHALRKSKDGVIVSFVVHPSDMTSDLLNLEIGSRVMIGWCKIEDGKEGEANIPDQRREQTDGHHTTKPPVATSEPGARSKRKMSDLPLSQQAALLDEDYRFKEFLSDKWPNLREQNSASIVRSCCGVSSRSEFDRDSVAAARWQTLHGAFLTWQASRDYADSIR